MRSWASCRRAHNLAASWAHATAQSSGLDGCQRLLGSGLRSPDPRLPAPRRQPSRWRPAVRAQMFSAALTWLSRTAALGMRVSFSPDLESPTGLVSRRSTSTPAAASSLSRCRSSFSSSSCWPAQERDREKDITGPPGRPACGLACLLPVASSQEHARHSGARARCTAAAPSRCTNDLVGKLPPAKFARLRPAIVARAAVDTLARAGGPKKCLQVALYYADCSDRHRWPFGTIRPCPASAAGCCDRHIGRGLGAGSTQDTMWHAGPSGGWCTECHNCMHPLVRAAVYGGGGAHWMLDREHRTKFPGRAVRAAPLPQTNTRFPCEALVLGGYVASAGCAAPRRPAQAGLCAGLQQRRGWRRWSGRAPCCVWAPCHPCLRSAPAAASCPGLLGSWRGPALYVPPATAHRPVEPTSAATATPRLLLLLPDCCCCCCCTSGERLLGQAATG